MTWAIVVVAGLVVLVALSVCRRDVAISASARRIWTGAGHPGSLHNAEGHAASLHLDDIRERHQNNKTRDNNNRQVMMRVPQRRKFGLGRRAILLNIERMHEQKQRERRTSE